MFWNQRPGWFGNQLDERVDALQKGDQSQIPWIFCVFAEKHGPSKVTAAKALHEILRFLSFDDIVRIDEQMRQTTSMEWSIRWRELSMDSFFVPQMSLAERRAVIIFASFNPNGFVREKAVRMMEDCEGTLPYMILRQNDWVVQVRQAAGAAVAYRLGHLTEGEILAALPFAEKLKWSSRGSHGEYTERFFSALTAPEHMQELRKGLESESVRTRRICTDALFGVSPPKIDLAFERLSREPEPFLRAVIFRRLSGAGQQMDTAISTFLADKYPVNRMLAFQYLLDFHADDIHDTAERLLLDSSAVVREAAQTAMMRQNERFDFRQFYLDNLDRHPAAAIYGLGERGEPRDAVEVEKYLGDVRSSVVKAAMTALAGLDYEKYNPVITALLNDARAGVVKMARNLLVKRGFPDYEKVREILHTTRYEHTKLKCMDILFGASKWSSVIDMLETVSSDEKRIAEKSFLAINRWLQSFNRSFALPSASQSAEIRRLIHSLQGVLPPKVGKELLFTLP